MKQIIFRSTLFLLLASMPMAQADVYWNNGGGDRSWGNALNWAGGGTGLLPSAAGAGNALVKPWPVLSQWPIVNTLNNTANEVYLTEGSFLSVVTGGSLTATKYITGQWNDTGVTDISGGLLQAGQLLIGHGAFDGKVNISGGDVVADYLSINTTRGALLNIGVNGRFTAPISNLGNINYWIANNAITAENQTAGYTINVDTTSSAGNVILTTIPEPSALGTLGVGLVLFFANRLKGRPKNGNFTA